MSSTSRARRCALSPLGQKRSRSAAVKSDVPEASSHPSPAPLPPPSARTDNVNNPRRSGTSERILLTAPRVPRKVALAMKAVGAEYSHEDGVTLLTCRLGDEAQKIFEKHLHTFSDDAEVDPLLHIFIRPPPGVQAAPPQLWPAITDEAGSILVQYRSRRASDFRHGLIPLVPVAQVGPLPAHVRFQHASMSGYRVMSRIATPRDAVACPAISSLDTETYLCTLGASWVGTCENTHVFRVKEEEEESSC